MSGKSKQNNDPSKPTREDWLKAALKANMARRKIQARARAAVVNKTNPKEN